MTKWFFNDNKETGLQIPDGFCGYQNKGCVLALGYFDGMHRGHQRVFSTMSKYADQYNTNAVAQTFLDMPTSKKSNGTSRGLLTTTEEKYQLMLKYGADSVVFFPFSEHFSSVTAKDFFENYIVQIFNPKVLVVGHDYRFGQGREGDVKILQRWGKAHDIEVIIVDPEIYHERVISSSWVRDRVLSADLEMATTLLGRMMSYSGTVIAGRKLGRIIGFPTANLYPNEEKILPPHGVYVSFVETESEIYEAVTNIGIRPTVAAQTQESDAVIESVVLNKKINLYDKNIVVYFAKMIREEKRFENISLLSDQIRKDITIARDDHNKNRRMYASFF